MLREAWMKTGRQNTFLTLRLTSSKMRDHYSDQMCCTGQFSRYPLFDIADIGCCQLRANVKSW
jgi:hypothetical protein